MLTFQEKLKIIESFSELSRRDVSLGRVNFHFEESVYDKKIVVQHLHPNGNGFIYASYLPKEKTDRKGFVNIRDFSEAEIREALTKSISYLSKLPDEDMGEEQFANLEGTWIGSNKQQLTLIKEDLLWNVYAGLNLEECFESPIEAERYLLEEGFQKKHL